MFLVIRNGFFLKGTAVVCSHLWCVEKKICFSLVLMLDVGDSVVWFLFILILHPLQMDWMFVGTRVTSLQSIFVQQEFCL